MSNNTPFSNFNPFLSLPDMPGKELFSTPKNDPREVPANAPEGSYTYALVQSAPSVPAEECEVAAAAVEVAIRWGATTLHVAHLAPPRSFHVGEATDKDAVDYLLPADKLGVARLPVVRKDNDGAARVVIPAGAKGTATIGDRVVKIAELAASGLAGASAEVSGALELPLSASTKVRFEVGGIEIEVASVNAGRKVSGRFSFDRRGLPFQAISMALHLGLLGAAAVLMPPMALASEDTMSSDRIADLKMILSTTAEREPEAVRDSGEDTASGDRTKGSADQRSSSADRSGSHVGPGSSRGSGPIGSGRDNPNAVLSKGEALAMARSFGMIGLLNGGFAGSPRASAWSDAGIPGDPRSTAGWDSSLESGGDGVIGLSGVGDNGGDGAGIDLGGVRTGGRPGDPGLFGKRGRRGTGHDPSGPSMRAIDTKTSGQIPREIIQRVVRQSFGRFRLCYENGLRNNPNLAGRVSVRFVIGRDGGVMSAANGGSDLPDAGVVSCVVSSFRGLQFPQSEDGGTATVVYPIAFAPAK